ncbi:hypothetical protein MWU58_09560 [Flavobacteriaceae bacterium S0825]|uniref:hypothetical protein n=1 Tax=Gaetbulibacter sp. S0825 TaxID=2720084 RepID=UPI001430B6BF|nr:hypothetical protein [Gaetbulibacter sp. S0825]MCK0109540.1 hypothetical protein [Flavobacteriaceae bacterium S0825]NIX65173.1 hypothetical protein [Gaetbulibacter sp. S0825]
MSIKKIRKQLEIVKFKEKDAPGMIFKLQGKFYTNTSYSQEVDEAFIKKHNLRVIKFKKPTKAL